MDKLRLIGLCILYMILLCIAFPLIVFSALGLYVVYKIVGVESEIVQEIAYGEVYEAWNNMIDIIADLVYGLRDFILDAKIEL